MMTTMKRLALAAALGFLACPLACSSADPGWQPSDAAPAARDAPARDDGAAPDAAGSSPDQGGLDSGAAPPDQGGAG